MGLALRTYSMGQIGRISRKVLRNVAAQVTRTAIDAALVRPALDAADRARGVEEWNQASNRYRAQSAIADALHDLAVDNIDRFLADNEKDNDE